MIPDGTLDLVEHASAIDEILGLAAGPTNRRGSAPSAGATCAASCWAATSRRRWRPPSPPRAPSPATSGRCAIGRDTYVDGGVRSPTNADVLRRRPDLDLAIVVSPMSGRDLGRLGVRNLVRRHARARLDGERKRLAAAGIPTVVIQPGPEVIDALGHDFMSDAGAPPTSWSAAFLDTGEQLRDPTNPACSAGWSTAAAARPRRRAAGDGHAARPAGRAAARPCDPPNPRRVGASAGARVGG